jgi:hypothetical protein
MMRNAVKGIILATLGVAFPRGLAAQSPQELIDRVMAAYGGPAALARVTSYEMRGSLDAPARGGKAVTIRTFQRPNRLRVVIHYPQQVEVRVLDGDKGWRGDERGLVAVTGPLLAAMRLQAARAAVPWILDEHRAEARPAPALTVKGFRYEGVEITVGEGLTLRAYVDSATHFVVNVQGRLVTPAMSTAFETLYGEFRVVQGVVFPFWEENFASGVHTGSTTFDTVFVNRALPSGGPNNPN